MLHFVFDFEKVLSYKVHMESTWSPQGVHLESTWSLQGVHRKYGTPGGLQVESTATCGGVSLTGQAYTLNLKMCDGLSAWIQR